MTGAWVLAVDFGTTNTVAAAARPGAAPRVLMVEPDAQMMPSAVYLDSPSEGMEEWKTGEAAENAAVVHPDRFDPAPKRSFGTGSVFLGGRSIDVSDVVAHVLFKVFDAAYRHHDQTDPTSVVLTHPATWRGRRLQRLDEAGRKAAARFRDWPDPTLLPEPIAAAWHVARHTALPTSCRITVVDLGGGTCDVAVVDRQGDRYVTVGPPLGLDPLGGDDFDTRLVQHVLDLVGEPELTRRLTTEPNPGDHVAAIELRSSCRRAKHTLSGNSIAHVHLPTLRDGPDTPDTQQVSRAELEELVRGTDSAPGLRDAARLAAAALEQAPDGPPLAGVFLVGGSSRIPLLGTLVTDATGLAPSQHGDVSTAVAEGAAWFALDQLHKTHEEVPPPAVVIPQPPDVQPPARRSRRTRWALVAAPVLLLALGAGAFAIIRDEPPIGDPPINTGGGPSRGGGESGSGSQGESEAETSGGDTDPGPEEPPPAPPPSTECWDGSSAPTEEECPLPSGPEGMAWVFADLDPAYCTDISYEISDAVGLDVEAWECPYQELGATVVYERWPSVREMEDYYGGEQSSGDTWTLGGEQVGSLWEEPASARYGLPFVASTYADFPYVFSVHAQTAEEADSLWEDITVTPPEDVLSTE